MSGLFTVLLAIALLGLILGLMKPGLVIYWGEQEKKTRKRVLIYYGIAAIVFFIVAVETV